MLEKGAASTVWSRMTTLLETDTVLRSVSCLEAGEDSGDQMPQSQLNQVTHNRASQFLPPLSLTQVIKALAMLPSTLGCASWFLILSCLRTWITSPIALQFSMHSAQLEP